MNVKQLEAIPVWDWPEDANQTLLGHLKDKQSDQSDRLIAVELAGEFAVMNDDLAEELLSIACHAQETQDIRARAVISFGPVLDFIYSEGFDDPEDVPISEPVFQKIQEALHTLYQDMDNPKQVRRRVMEASIRAPQDWHHQAIQEAYASQDEDWKLTAVFCMRYLQGFDHEIREALKSKNKDIHYEAVLAAGNWQVEGSWLHIREILEDTDTDKELLLATIEAASNYENEDVAEHLYALTDSDDEDIVETAYEALAIVGEPMDLEELDDYDFGEDEDEDDDEDDMPF